VRRVVLLRHGRTEWNASGRFQGQLDSPLDPTGRAQAAAAGAALLPMQADALVSSDLKRTLDTAQVVAEACGLEVAVDERLREIHLGAWQGLTRAEARSSYPQEYARWQAGEDARRGGGETYAEVGVRARACVDDWLERLGEGSLLLTVTHGEGHHRHAARNAARHLVAAGSAVELPVVDAGRQWTGLAP
jgi:broad specificity phosphatase PhoE